jgi:hypothetical protein
VHWGCDYATTLNIEVDPQRRRFGRRESDFALQRLIECRALETERVRLVALRWHSSGIQVRLGLRVGLKKRRRRISPCMRVEVLRNGGEKRNVLICQRIVAYSYSLCAAQQCPLSPREQLHNRYCSNKQQSGVHLSSMQGDPNRLDHVVGPCFHRRLPLCAGLHASETLRRSALRRYAQQWIAALWPWLTT